MPTSKRRLLKNIIPTDYLDSDYECVHVRVHACACVRAYVHRCMRVVFVCEFVCARTRLCVYAHTPMYMRACVVVIVRAGTSVLHLDRR